MIRLLSLIGLASILAGIAFSRESVAEDKPLNVAVITTVWYHNSHSDIIAGRILESHTLDGKGEYPKLKIASLYVDQFPTNDKSRDLAAKHSFPIYDTIEKSLTLGGDKLAVDGVLLIAEHGKYSESPSGQFMFPKRRMFSEIARVFERDGRVVPIFNDKHISDNWEDIAWIRGEIARLKIPVLAGSSLPTLWRYPPTDVKRDAPLKQIVGVSYHRLDAYGFHGLEMLQCLAERRKGGESGIRQVRCLTGDAVWRAGEEGVYDPKLLDQAVARLKERPLAADKKLREVVKQPILFVIDYEDGLRSSLLTLDGLFIEWAAAWQYADGSTDATLFWTQEERPFMHFGFQMNHIDAFLHAGKPQWPVERTVLTSGVLDALLQSKLRGGEPLATPQLKIAYQSEYDWKEPPPPPPGRPINGQ
jgi:hypothetical protein